ARGDEWGDAFRERYGNAAGTAIPIVVRRGGMERTFTATVRLERVINVELEFDPNVGAKAARVRSGILRGRTDGQTDRR
ncbi:MAG: hypothetical protein ACT4PM_02835, partial [Gemmatimonadales bacterium]